MALRSEALLLVVCHLELPSPRAPGPSLTGVAPVGPGSTAGWGHWGRRLTSGALRRAAPGFLAWPWNRARTQRRPTLLQCRWVWSPAAAQTLAPSLLAALPDRPSLPIPLGLGTRWGGIELGRASLSAVGLSRRAAGRTFEGLATHFPVPCRHSRFGRTPR